MHERLRTSGKKFSDAIELRWPPCAFNNFATCPLPAFQNRLKLKVTAGEKTYAH